MKCVKSKKRAVKPGGTKANAKLDTEHKRIQTHEPIHEEKHDRNAPCFCGSGKKLKKCHPDGPGIWREILSWLGLR